MSLSRLMLAVRNTLRTHLADPFEPAFKSSDIQIRPDGQPPAVCGEWFISVYGTGLSQRSPEDDLNVGIGEEYEITCALTRRVSHIPFDRLGEEAYIKATTGMEDVCHAMIGIIAGSSESRYLEVLDDANTLITNDVASVPVDGIDFIIEPLRWLQTTPTPILVDESWFIPIQDQYNRRRVVPDANDVIAGMVMNVVFGKAFRPQAGHRFR